LSVSNHRIATVLKRQNQDQAIKSAHKKRWTWRRTFARWVASPNACFSLQSRLPRPSWHLSMHMDTIINTQHSVRVKVNV